MGRMTRNNSTDRPSVWPCLPFRDATAAMDFLVGVFGCVEWARRTEDDTLRAGIGWPQGRAHDQRGRRDRARVPNRPVAARSRS